MIDDIIVGHVYKSAQGYPYKVEGLAEHGKDPDATWVQLHNLTETPLFRKGHRFSIKEAVFKEKFSVYAEGTYHEHNVRASSEMPRLRSCILPLLG